jgi:hypothetical protein
MRKLISVMAIMACAIELLMIANNAVHTQAPDDEICKCDLGYPIREVG